MQFFFVLIDFICLMIMSMYNVRDINHEFNELEQKESEKKQKKTKRHVFRIRFTKTEGFRAQKYFHCVDLGKSIKIDFKIAQNGVRTEELCSLESWIWRTRPV